MLRLASELPLDTADATAERIHNGWLQSPVQCRANMNRFNGIRSAQAQSMDFTDAIVQHVWRQQISDGGKALVHS